MRFVEMPSLRVRGPIWRPTASSAAKKQEIKELDLTKAFVPSGPAISATPAKLPGKKKEIVLRPKSIEPEPKQIEEENRDKSKDAKKTRVNSSLSPKKPYLDSDKKPISSRLMDPIGRLKDESLRA